MTREYKILNFDSTNNVVSKYTKQKWPGLKGRHGPNHRMFLHVSSGPDEVNGQTIRGVATWDTVGDRPTSDAAPHQSDLRACSSPCRGRTDQTEQTPGQNSAPTRSKTPTGHGVWGVVTTQQQRGLRMSPSL